MNLKPKYTMHSFMHVPMWYSFHHRKEGALLLLNKLSELRAWATVIPLYFKLAILLQFAV
jgi:hypothetical protein